MSSRTGPDTSALGSLPRPGRALTYVMVGLLSVWLMFAAAINWAGASEEVFLLFCGNTERILSGEIWRLFTAPVMHAPSGGIGHILFALVGLFFLTPILEQRWGGARTLRFLFFSGLIAYGLQMAVELLLPSVAARLVGHYWFGAFPVVHAIAIAWAMTFKGQTVRLMFVLPVTSTGLIAFVVAISLLRVIAVSQAPEGLLSPFGGMFAGWLLGGGTPSPLRRAYLKLRLAQLDREAAQARLRRRQRAGQSSLKVIEGGRSRRKGKGHESGEGGDGKGPDGHLLN